MADQVRQPVQKRSIETKKKIIIGGYKAFSEQGFFATNTAEIAKMAGVSTGIVYGYFKDKKDILLDVLDIYVDKVYGPVFDIFDKSNTFESFEDMVDAILATTVKIHKDNAKMHETLNALSHTDSEVNSRFEKLEDEITETLVKKLSAHGYDFDDIYERVHVAMNIVHSYASECVFDSHDYIDEDVMCAIVKNIIINMFKK